MCYWNLGQKDLAQAVLAKGETLAPRISPTQSSVDLGDNWVAWLFARISLDEADAFVQAGSPSDKDPSQP
jgi:hypothetical protein